MRSRHKVLRIKNTAQIEQEGVVVNATQDGWLGLPKTLGDFFGGQLAMPNGNDRAGEFFLRQRSAADLGGCILDAQRECTAERDAE